MITVTSNSQTLQIKTYTENQVERKNYAKTLRSITGGVLTSSYGYDKIVRFIFLLTNEELEFLYDASRGNFFIQGAENLLAEKICFFEKIQVLRKNREADIYFIEAEIGQFFRGNE